jgi:hypothetical protein
MYRLTPILRTKPNHANTVLNTSSSAMLSSKATGHPLTLRKQSTFNNHIGRQSSYLKCTRTQGSSVRLPFLGTTNAWYLTSNQSRCAISFRSRYQLSSMSHASISSNTANPCASEAVPFVPQRMDVAPKVTDCGAASGRYRSLETRALDAGARVSEHDVTK